MATIVWDRDDVLNDLMRCWLEDCWKPSHANCKVSYSDLVENPPHRILGVSLEEYLTSLDEFRLSEQASEIKPVSEVLDWFRRYGQSHRHLVLTSTSLRTAPAAAAWTFRHFGPWIQSFHLVPSLRENQPRSWHGTDKGAYLAWLGKGDVLVEDSVSSLESAKRYDIAGVLIPRPWNGNSGSIRDALERLGAAVGTRGRHFSDVD